jgi:thioredoxin-related protein
MTHPLKTYFLFAGLLFSILPSFAQDGIQFFHGSWDEAQSEAKKQKKLIFVDAFAVWCGPCKAMDRNTFADPKVGEFFNEKFINYKFDMEKGEGPAFARKYQVTAYPTLLFINHKGDLVHRALGYKAPPAFLTEARQALDPAKNEALQELAFEEGSASSADLYNYAMNLKQRGEDYSEAAAKYFATQSPKQLRSKANWKAIKELSWELDGPEFLYLIKKRKKFSKLHGAMAVEYKISEVLRKATIAAALQRKPDQYQEAIRLAGRLKDDGQTSSYLKVVYAEAKKDWADYAFKASYHYNHYVVSEAKELDQLINNFILHVDNLEQLEAARKWPGSRLRSATKLTITPPMPVCCSNWGIISKLSDRQTKLSSSPFRRVMRIQKNMRR